MILLLPAPKSCNSPARSGWLRKIDITREWFDHRHPQKCYSGAVIMLRTVVTQKLMGVRGLIGHVVLALSLHTSYWRGRKQGGCFWVDEQEMWVTFLGGVWRAGSLSAKEFFLCLHNVCRKVQRMIRSQDRPVQLFQIHTGPLVPDSSNCAVVPISWSVQIWSVTE